MNRTPEKWRAEFGPARRRRKNGAVLSLQGENGNSAVCLGFPGTGARQRAGPWRRPPQLHQWGRSAALGRL